MDEGHKFAMTLVAVLLFCVILIQGWATSMHKVVRVDGHTCITTRGLVRSISCDWGHGATEPSRAPDQQ